LKWDVIKTPYDLESPPDTSNNFLASRCLTDVILVSGGENLSASQSSSGITGGLGKLMATYMMMMMFT
jgi:hypothetical protein